MPQFLGIEIDLPSQQDAYTVGVLILEGIQKRLTGPRHGRWYPVPGNRWYDKHSGPQLRDQENYHVKFTGTYDRSKIKGAAYRASAPGEPPAVRTGRLRQSFFMTVMQKSSTVFTVTVRSNVNYADDLNYGTDKIDPRPFIEPVMRELALTIYRMQVRGVFRAVRI